MGPTTSKGPQPYSKGLIVMNIFIGIVVLFCGILSLLPTVIERLRVKKIVPWIVIVCGFFMCCNDYLFGRWVEDTITSGGSFCYFRVEDIGSAKNTGVLKLYHKGEYPLYGLEFTTAYWDDSEQHFVATSKGIVTETGIIIGGWHKVGIIYPGQIEIMNPALPLKNGQHLGFLFRDGNTRYEQELILEKKEGEWISKTQIIRNIDNKELYQKTRTVNLID